MKNKKKVLRVLIAAGVVILLLLGWYAGRTDISDVQIDMFRADLTKASFTLTRVEKENRIESCAMPPPLKPLPECAGRTAGRQSMKVLVAHVQVASCLVIIVRSINDPSVYIVTTIGDRDILHQAPIFARSNPPKVDVEQFILRNKQHFPCTKGGPTPARLLYTQKLKRALQLLG